MRRLFKLIRDMIDEVKDNWVQDAPPEQQQPSRHCSAIGCPEVVPEGHAFCDHHWGELPREIQHVLFRAYQPNQGRPGGPQPSMCYLKSEAAAVACIAIAEKRFRPDDPVVLAIKRQLGRKV